MSKSRHVSSAPFPAFRRGGPAAAVAIALTASPALAQAPAIELIGTGVVPGDASDGLELLPKVLEDGVTPHDRVGGWGSGLAYTGVGSIYAAVPDRGPADGTTSYVDRVYLFDVRIAPGAAVPVSIALVRATTLTNEAGELFTGSAAAFDARNSPQGRRFDPEAIRLSGDGSFFVSDEYGPFLYELSPTGERLGIVRVPRKFRIGAPSADAALELPPGNTSGRQANRGMEGLAISPDGKKLYGLMQNALIQDGALDAANKRVGMNVRLLEIDRESGATRELVYPLDHKGNGLNEIVAINDHEFLVIERDGDAGTKAERKKIYKIDITGATDVSDIAALPTATPVAGVVPVSKQLFIDLLDPAFGLAGASFPEKIEGLAFGPALADGRLTLLVTADNDFKATQASQVFAFAIAPAALPGFAAQELHPEVDVQPHTRRKVIQPGQPGQVPVGIYGADLLPAAAFDVATLRVAGAPVASFGRGRRPACSRFDENDDGYQDLVCLFDQARMVAPADGRNRVELTGSTTTGSPLRATARVRVVRPE